MSVTLRSAAIASTRRYRGKIMNTEIVADGARRRLDTKAVEERRKELKEDFEKEYANELESSNWFKRVLIKNRIRRMIYKTINEEFRQSPHVLNRKVKL